MHCFSQSVFGSAPMNRKRCRSGASSPRRSRGCASARARDCRLAVQRHDLGLGQHLDVRLRRDALDQIARHAGLEAAAAHQQPHLLHLAGQIDSRLSGRIAGADQRHLLAGAEPRFDAARPSSARASPRIARGWRHPAGGSARRWRSPRCGHARGSSSASVKPNGRRPQRSQPRPRRGSPSSTPNFCAWL